MIKLKRPFISLIWFQAILILLTINLKAQENEALTIINYNSRNGLPQNSVVDMIMDSGYLWMCTEVGLVRFDGNRFKIFNTGITKSKKPEHFKLIVTTLKNEKIACAADGTLVLMNANEARPYPGTYITTGTNMDINGGVLSLSMLTDLLIPNFSNIQIHYGYVPTFIPLGQYSFLSSNEKEIVWFRASKETVHFPLSTGKIVNLFMFENNAYLTDDKNNLFNIDLANKRMIRAQFYGDIDKGAGDYSKSKLKVFWRYGDKTPVLMKDGKIYLLRGQDRNRNILTEKFVDECPKNTLITKVIYDNNSRQLYLGTDTKGLFIYKRKIIRSYVFEENETVKNNAYYAMVTPDSNNIITSFGKVFSVNGPEKTIENIRNFNRECILLDDKNQLLFVSRDSILSYNLSTKETKYVCGTKGNSTSTFYRSGDTVFVGTSVEIGYLYKNSYHSICEFDNRKMEKPENIIRGPDGDLWFSSCKGVFKISYATGHAKTVAVIENICARYLFMWKDLVMFATYGDGYYIWRKGVIYKMPLDENSNLSITHSFLVDKKNFLWISSNHGLFKTSMTTIYNYLNDTSKQVFYKYFGEDDGLRSVEFNGGCFPNSIVLKNGYFAFPTMDGIAIFDPLNSDNTYEFNQVYIDEIKVDGENVPLNHSLIVNPNTENISFQLTSPQPAGNQNLILEYMLEGYNKSWTKLAPGHFTISFSNLPFGNYHLKIRNRMGYLPVNYLNPIYSFTVSKKYYQTYWFIISVILLLCLLVWQAVAQYFNNLRRTNLNLERLIDSRTAELRQTNEQLEINIKKLSYSEKSLKQNVEVKNKLISIISHDIIAPLHFISMVARNAVNNKDQPLQTIISEIKESSEKLYFNAQNILNWIKNQNQKIEVKTANLAVNPLVEELLEMNQEFAKSKGNILENAVSYDDIIRTDKYILSIILNNLISNANKYCNKSEIKISADTINEHYQICIADNGPGIPEEILESIRVKLTDSNIDFSETKTNQNGLGYIIIYEMSQLINAKIAIESTAEKGTCVRIVF